MPKNEEKKPVRIDDAIEMFLVELDDNAKEATVRNYTQRLSVFLTWLQERGEGSLVVTEMDLPLLSKFKGSLKKRTQRFDGHNSRPIQKGGLSKDSQRTYVQAVKRWCTWLVKKKFIDESPAVELTLPSAGKPQPKAISDEDVTRLLFLLQGRIGKTPLTSWQTQLRHWAIRDYALVLFLLDTGCRLRGVSEITLDRLHLEEGYAEVTEKGDDTRPVPFLDVTAVALRAYLEIRPSGYGDDLWIGRWGVLGGDGIYKILRELAAEAGCTGRTNPHSFRHHLAVSMLDAGCDLGTVSQILGHANARTTLQYYAQRSQKQLIERHKKYSPLRHLSPIQRKEDERKIN